jgi:hypothetical protein
MKPLFHHVALSLVAAAAACSTDKSSNTAAPAPAPSAVTAPTSAPAAPPTAAASTNAPAPLPVQVPVPVPTPSFPPPQPAGVLAVVSVNGLEVDGSGSTITDPGEAVTLVADVLVLRPGCASLACAERQSIGVDQLTWSADDRPGDLCQGQRPELCARLSSFALDGNGVTFRTPHLWRGDITVTVRETGTALVGTFILRNSEAPDHGPGPGGTLIPPGGAGGPGPFLPGQRQDGGHAGLPPAAH